MTGPPALRGRSRYVPLGEPVRLALLQGRCAVKDDDLAQHKRYDSGGPGRRGLGIIRSPLLRAGAAWITTPGIGSACVERIGPLTFTTGPGIPMPAFILALSLVLLILAWFSYWARWVSWDLTLWDTETPSDWREATRAADLRALSSLERRRENVLFGYRLWLSSLRASSIVQFVVTGSVAGFIIDRIVSVFEPAAGWRSMAPEERFGLVTLAVGLLAGAMILVTALVRTDRRFKAAVWRLDSEIAEQRRRVSESRSTAPSG